MKVLMVWELLDTYINYTWVLKKEGKVVILYFETYSAGLDK